MESNAVITLAKAVEIFADYFDEEKRGSPKTNAITDSPVQTSLPVDRGQSTQPPATDSKVSQPTTPSPDTQGAYTVHISDAAKQALQAMMKEATETSYQTAQKVSHGDLQAQGLPAKEAAAKKVS